MDNSHLDDLSRLGPEHFADTIDIEDGRGPKELRHLGQWLPFPTPSHMPGRFFVKLSAPIKMKTPQAQTEDGTVPIPAGHFLIIFGPRYEIVPPEQMERVLEASQKRKDAIEEHPDAIKGFQVEEPEAVVGLLEIMDQESGVWIPVRKLEIAEGWESDVPDASKLRMLTSEARGRAVSNVRESDLTGEAPFVIATEGQVWVYEYGYYDPDRDCYVMVYHRTSHIALPPGREDQDAQEDQDTQKE